MKTPQALPLKTLLILSLLTACGPGDTASSEGNNWSLDDNKTTMDMGMDSDLPDGGQGVESDMLEGSDMPLCGNGVVDDGEICDGNCPESSSVCPPPPADACTISVYSGSPETCDATCEFLQETRCTGDDGCCPEGCTFEEDSDCSEPPPNCGNGIIDDEETCDGDCPETITDCMPSTACELTELQGDADMCTSECVLTVIDTCISDDGCCPQGCTFNEDSDCEPPEPVCGNGIIEGNEACDGDCPMTEADCDDQNACTNDLIAGDASMCTAMCGSTPVTACSSGDGCCPQGCEGMDSDCDETDLCNQSIPTAPPYGPASIINMFALGDANTGFDIDNDGTVNNSLGGFIDTFGSNLGFSRANYNQTVDQLIQSGQLALLLEHESLTGLIGPQTYTINVLNGAPRCFAAPDPQGGNFYDVEAASYTPQGVPRTQLAPSTFSSMNQIAGTATPTSEFIFEFDLAGVILKLPVKGLRITADLNPVLSSLPSKGIALANGLLGGYLALDDMYSTINDFVIADCSCVSGPNMPLINVNGSNSTCNGGFNASSCGGSQIDQACATVIDNCSLLTGLFVTFTADINTQNPDTPCGSDCDAISVGFDFTAAGARILEETP